MNRAQIENSLHELNNLVISGNLLEAFEKYYHDDIAMQENELPPTVSKEANRQREIEFLNNITEFRKAEVKGIDVVSQRIGLRCRVECLRDGPFLYH